MSDKKIKILTLSDHPLLPSGVGSQTKYVMEALLKTGKFQIISLGGAVTHPSYEPAKVQEYGDDWIIIPVDGYGNPEQLRAVLIQHRPDILYFMTDPRFYDWLWNMDDEIRQFVPMVYYHVWDNYPMPHFNSQWYNSTDVIATISKVTSDIVQTVSPKVEEQYIPHSVDTEVFRNLSRPNEKERLKSLKNDNPHLRDKFIFFWNNRNARRKQSGSLLFWYKKFVEKVGNDKTCLLMHTDPHDPHGQPIEFLMKDLGLVNGEVVLSKQKLPADELAFMYNISDCTINISDAEGFGLATLESLACETPIIVNMTGGLQEQVTDGENWFGIGLRPTSKAIIGSQSVPFIYEDRLNEEVVVEAMEKIYRMSPKERQELGSQGRQHVMDNYNFETFNKSWVDLMTKTYEKHGSWENRKHYSPWECIEL